MLFIFSCSLLWARKIGGTISYASPPPIGLRNAIHKLRDDLLLLLLPADDGDVNLGTRQTVARHFSHSKKCEPGSSSQHCKRQARQDVLTTATHERRVVCNKANKKNETIPIVGCWLHELAGWLAFGLLDIICAVSAEKNENSQFSY